MKTFDEAMKMYSIPVDGGGMEAAQTVMLETVERQDSMIHEFAQNGQAQALVDLSARILAESILAVKAGPQAGEELLDLFRMHIGSAFSQGVMVGMEMERQDIPEPGL